MKTKHIVQLTNDQLYPSISGDGQHGGVYAANDNNFDSEHLSEPLTEYIVGFPDDDGLQALLDAAAPMVPCERSFSYRVHDSKEQFQMDALDDADIREIGGDFAMVR